MHKEMRNCRRAPKLYLLAFFFIASFIAHACLQQDEVVVSPKLNLRLSTIVNDGMHNGFPDLIHWKGIFYLAYRSASSHIGSKSAIKVLSSLDGVNWTPLATLSAEEDVRDPKFASLGDTLFLYAVKNDDIVANPYTTIVSSSGDGIQWQPWRDVSPQGWVFWRPKGFDSRTLYVAADFRKNKTSGLFRSTDGVHWEMVSTIYSGELNAEIEISFQSNRDLICTVRVEGIEGDPKTLIGNSPPPYSVWNFRASRVTRLDGPSIFSFERMLFVAGRYEPNGTIFPMGSLLNRKRTSIFLIHGGELLHLVDLPSSGDTGYSAVVTRNNVAYIVYYTSDASKDLPWIVGQFGPTQIMMSTIDLKSLVRMALNQQTTKSP